MITLGQVAKQLYSLTLSFPLASIEWNGKYFSFCIEGYCYPTCISFLYSVP